MKQAAHAGSLRHTAGLAGRQNVQLDLADSVTHQHAKREALMSKTWQISQSHLPSWSLKVSIVWTQVSAASYLVKRRL